MASSENDRVDGDATTRSWMERGVRRGRVLAFRGRNEPGAAAGGLEAASGG